MNILAKKGRPETPSYRKKSMRYSKVEDALKNIMEQLSSDKDRLIINKVLEQLKD